MVEKRLIAMLLLPAPFNPISRGDGRNRTDDEGFADPCLTTWLRRLIAYDKQATVHAVVLGPERAMGFEPMTFSLARRHSTAKLRPRL